MELCDLRDLRAPIRIGRSGWALALCRLCPFLTPAGEANERAARVDPLGPLSQRTLLYGLTSGKALSTSHVHIGKNYEINKSFLNVSSI